jgi:hypothetical protein
MTYSLDALKKNRVSTLVYGGAEADRRGVAITASQELPGAGVLVEAKDASSLERALSNPRSVVYVPDVTALPPTTQRLLVRVMREREERPKLVLGLPISPDTATEKGGLTEDLKFWLARSTVEVKGRGARK